MSHKSRALIASGAVALTALLCVAPAAAAVAQEPGERRHEVTADYDCETWIGQEAGKYYVALECDSIRPGVRVRGVLDIKAAPDFHTPYIEYTGVGVVHRSGTVGELATIRGTRVEQSG